MYRRVNMTHNPQIEEYLKEEMRNLRQEYIHAQNEVKRIASIPLMIGHFLEGIDATTCIVAPTSGQNFYVRILSTVDREKLKPSAAVCLHKFSHSLVDVLPPESDSSIQDRFDSEKPDFSIIDNRGSITSENHISFNKSEPRKVGTR